jgi:hypothetical protein
MSMGISQLENRNWLFKKDITIEGDMTVEGDFTFGDASTDSLEINGYVSYGASTANYMIDMSASTPAVADILLSNSATISNGAAGTLTITETAIELVGTIKLDGTVTFDDDGTLTDAADVMTITQDTIALAGATAITLTGPTTITGTIKLDGAVTFDDDATLTDAANVTTLTQNTITLAGATKINLDGPVDISGAIVMDSAETTGFTISGVTTTGIDISGAATGILIDGVSGAAAAACIYLNPTRTADTSTTPLRIAYNYDGSGTTGDIDLFSIRSTITQTGTNALGAGFRGYIQGMRSDINISGFSDLAYGMYSKVTCTGTTTSAEIYGVTSAVYLSTFEATATHVAALFGKVNGTGNVVGSGAADVVGASGLYLSWSSTNAMATCLTAGAHIAIEASSLCDSGYQVDVGGTLVNGVFVRNTGGTLTNAVKVAGAGDFVFDFDDATGSWVDATSTEYTGTCAGHILVKMQDGSTAYINCWTN